MFFHPRSALFRSGRQAGLEDGSTSKSNGDRSGQDKGRTSPTYQALLLARHSLSCTLFVCDLTTALREWEWSLHPPRRKAQRESKSLLVSPSSLVGPVLQADLGDSDGRWQTRSGRQRGQPLHSGRTQSPLA